MKYRIKQIDENKFLPQVKTWLLGYWRNIDKDSLFIWHSLIASTRWCICSTYEEAKQVIDNYKLHFKQRKDTIAATAKEMFYPKYHKL
jgi:hypothetical protein